MEKFETIIVATALDKRDATSLRHAARIARALQPRTVCLAHIEPSLDLPTSLRSEEAVATADLDRRTVEELTQLIHDHRGLFPAATQLLSSVRRGSRVPELVQLAAEQSADLLVLCRRPRDEHDAISSAAETLQRKAPCSVLVVPEEVEANYARILVPCDFSDASRGALEMAISLARATPSSSTITVQHVYSAPVGYERPGHKVDEFTAMFLEYAQQQWADFHPTLNWSGVPWTVRFDREDNIPRAVNAAAAELDASLLILGSHGRTRPAGVLLGHVADVVGKHTARPFLCVKKKGEVVTLLKALLQLY